MNTRILLPIFAAAALLTGCGPREPKTETSPPADTSAPAPGAGDTSTTPGGNAGDPSTTPPSTTTSPDTPADTSPTNPPPQDP